MFPEEVKDLLARFGRFDIFLFGRGGNDGEGRPLLGHLGDLGADNADDAVIDQQDPDAFGLKDGTLNFRLVSATSTPIGPQRKRSGSIPM
jgi:hypothetical protein